MPESYQEHQTPGKSAFLCAPYYAGGEGGRYEPLVGIDRCPLAAGGEPCHVVKHSFRNRKTGPEIALRILHCKLHDRHFTVYPTGHVPHGRQALAKVDLGGKPIKCLEEPEHEDSALDTQPVGEKTLRRRIERDALLLGLAPSLPRRVVEEIRDQLGVVGCDHHAARERFQQADSLQERGSTILDTQHQVTTDSSRVLRLLAAGFLSNLWGHPYHWDGRIGQRISLLSQTSRVLRAPPY